MSETPHVGQVRQFFKVEETTYGPGMPDSRYISDSKAEAWTGTEWVDVRELVQRWNETQP